MASSFIDNPAAAWDALAAAASPRATPRSEAGTPRRLAALPRRPWPVEASNPCACGTPLAAGGAVCAYACLCCCCASGHVALLSAREEHRTRVFLRACLVRPASALLSVLSMAPSLVFSCAAAWPQQLIMDRARLAVHLRVASDYAELSDRQLPTMRGCCAFTCCGASAYWSGEHVRACVCGFACACACA